MTSSPRLSVAIPLHNEESVLPELLQRVVAVLDALPGGPHEMVFVDDGSTDSTFYILEVAANSDPRIIAVSLSRNYGHQSAVSAALDFTSGDATVVMDGDLQDVPEVIPEFVKRFQEGYDVVYAQRVRRKEPWPLRVCYFVFYRVMAKLSDVQLPLDSGDFSLMSKRVVDHLRRMPEHHRYLRGMRTWVGFKQIGIPVERAARHSGKSKYSFRRLVRLAFDGIFAFSIVPIRAATLLGILVIGLSSVYTLYSIYAKFVLQRSPQGFTALMSMMTFLTGTLLLFLGIIGEYVGRVYEETKGRPHYVVGRTVGQLVESESAGSSLRGAQRSPSGNPVR
jgi:glycosyltransferase involved in cell wall biosynthesis